MSEHFVAWRFDGRTATPQRIGVRVVPARLVLESAEAVAEIELPLADARVSESFENSPCVVRMASGETIEVTDGAGFTRALEAAGFRIPPVVRLQRRWPLASLALALLLAALPFAYFWGIPAAARLTAAVTPPGLQRRMGHEILDVLDREFLAPSNLAVARRDAIALRFAVASLRSAPAHAVRLEFRSLRAEQENLDEPTEEKDSPDDTSDEAVNAFSLPGGTVILLDGLVEVGDRDEVFAVLGHELGHIVHGHSMQHLFQTAGVVALAGLAWGDFSGVAASIPTALGLLRYSRDLEVEADDFAVRFLADHGLDAQPLCRFFERVRELELEAGVADFPEFLSTHPDTEQRMARICSTEEAKDRAERRRRLARIGTSAVRSPPGRAA